MINRESSIFIQSVSWIILAAILGGCSRYFGPGNPTPIPDLAYTQAAQTIIADLTENAPENTPTLSPAVPTDTQAAIQTPLATSTPSPTETPLPSPTSTPMPPDTEMPTATQVAGRLVYEDDFSKESGWAQQQNDSWSMGYANGGYFIEVNITDAPIWSVRNQELEDGLLEVDASRSQGPASGYYGLVCRHLNGDNYYTLVVSDEGPFGIGIVEDGEKLRFLQEGIAPPEVLNPAGTPNRLRADCVGTTLSLYANGVKLAEVQDSTFDAGDSGLLAGTWKETGLLVVFDNMIARSPE